MCIRDRRAALRLLGTMDPKLKSQRLSKVLNGVGKDVRLYRELIATMMHLGVKMDLAAPKAATASGIKKLLAGADVG